ncbi:OmpA family protein [Flavobacterium sp. N2820]|jgi:outer membrane protein OmpA-like peptidoglycan-associated protein/tetratricopeptide (TPR) repeat protein|uniref:OmpA family protein n=1 Tax=Flavobacterium sp. N2820 TaxID=2986834 RepID=UPI002224F084|nr:OmpA family protein [Flavobacterium sp. N2820]
MKIKVILLLFVLSISSGFAQKIKLSSADKKYDNLAYIDAIEIYEGVAEKGYKSVDLFQKLGNSYYFNANLLEANRWYSELFALGQDVAPEYYFRYSQTLKSIGDYTKANEYLTKFSQKTAADNRAKIFESNKDYLAEIKRNSGRQKIEDAGINTEYSDFGGSFYKENFVFTSARDSSGISNVKHTWTNASFYNLYSATVSSEGYLVDAAPLSKKINSKFNESSAVFTKDSTTMYFTRNNYTNGKQKTDAEKTTLLKLYKSTKDDQGKWDNVEELPFNSDEYSCAHPALSPDDKILYFASNMPGTVGESDIFKVAINADGSFGTPESLGGGINTEARETFPFVTDENEIFFASDGQLGLGGLDIFSVKINEDGSMSKVFNVGAPVNSPQDDFAYLMDSKTRFGFFSSNREGGKGNDDIYKFVEQIPLSYTCKQVVSGVITDEETKEVLANAKVTLFDEKMNSISEMIANENGEYRFEGLECEKTYFVRAEKKDYETVETSVVTGSVTGETKSKLPITKRVKQVGVGSDLAKSFDIKIIYFNLDKSNIRPDAALQLEKILQVMKKNPTMKIDVRSHTDCRQTAKYNQALSDRRAKSTIAWLVESGISAERLTGRGYGELQLINDCGCEPANESKCSEEEHEANRRSEFIVISM